MTSTLGGIARLLTGVAAVVIVASPAQAQVSHDRSRAKRVRFDIPAGPLGDALRAWGKQAGKSIIFKSEDVSSIRSAGIRGVMTADDALDALLAHSGFLRIDDTSGAVAIVTAPALSSDNDGRATPEILVSGRRSWSLNTGIERTQDDSQPFIVLSREEIQQSGAPNLEAFLRDRLNVNSSPGVSEQTKPGNAGTSLTRGLSSFNLRGLGTRDTLILVDGRRQPGVNIGNGTITQASITGIPIAAIERIEVLASSASGIYGSGASGGVINIVLKRDFSGGELTTTYGNTTDFVQGQGQIDLTYGLPLEGGRTRLSFAGSWLKSRPLYYGDRSAISRRAIERILNNDPAFFQGAFQQPPAGASVNYSSSNGRPLTLKPAFGGTTLGSTYGHVPAGYKGIAIDGIGPLLSGVGVYDYEPADSSVNLGSRYPLLYGSERINATISARREFNSWLTGYASATFARTKSNDRRSRGPDYVQIAADAPNNPFTQAVQITLPGVAPNYSVFNQQDQRSVLGGFIAKLPSGWQAVVDLSYSYNTFNADVIPPTISDGTRTQLRTGVQDTLRDVIAFPLALVYDDLPFSSRRTPGASSTFAPSIRLAGPLPVSLPGGRAQMTMNVEYSDEWVGPIKSAQDTGIASFVTYNDAAKQQTWSIYGEVALPLIGKKQHVPLMEALELRFSARSERYSGGGGRPLSCTVVSGPLPAGDPFANCPPPGVSSVRGATSNSHTDPSVSLLWTPVEGIAIRGSYTTGYLPPSLSQLIRRRTDQFYLLLNDPLRGNEPIGVDNMVVGFSGGNPDVRPESSRTISTGIILTPKFLDGLRLSADWSHIRKRDVYFDPSILTFALLPGNQSAFNLLLATYPDRVVREAPSGGYAFGRITSVDLSLVNLVGISTDAVDFVVDYSHNVLGGKLNATGRATYVDNLKVESFPGAAPVDYAGVVTSDFASAAGSNGSLRWRGSVAATWSKDRLSFGWQARYFDSYALNTDHSVVKAQGSASIPSQLYHDVNVSYKLPFGAMVRANISNVFDKNPPYDTTSRLLYYSAYADVRLRTFSISVSKSF